MDSINGISYYLNSQQMLDAIKHITDDNFFLSGRQQTGAFVCVTQSN